jgi:hypothetical protein
MRSTEAEGMNFENWTLRDRMEEGITERHM